MDTVFGPVYSRRLGWSLGINNLPDKICSYSCVYCQAGRTCRRTVHRQGFYSPHTIYRHVRTRLEACDRKRIPVDYLTIVPNGEPTLDKNLKTEIEMLKRLERKVAVITNGSLIWMKEVREALLLADWVGVKLDCTHAEDWEKLNRPYKRLNIDRILGGILEFSDHYRKNLTTETMVVRDFNDHWGALESTARFLSFVKPKSCYIAVPTRPPAEKKAKIPLLSDIDVAEKLFHVHGLRVECLLDEATEQGPWPGDLVEQLVAIARVHPVDQISVEEHFRREPGYRNVVQKLLQVGRLQKTLHNGKMYYVAGNRQVTRVPDHAIEESNRRSNCHAHR